jgi:hypothetical protein
MVSMIPHDGITFTIQDADPGKRTARAGMKNGIRKNRP